MMTGDVGRDIMKRKHEWRGRGGKAAKLHSATRYNIPSFGHGGIDYVYLSLGTPGETGLKS